MIVAVKGQSYETVSDHFQDQSRVVKMKGRFREDGFAGEQRLGLITCSATLTAHS